MTDTTLLLGCGEWGFRELGMEAHFQIAKEFGFHYLEFGIGGDFPGRLSGTMNGAEVGQFTQLGRKYGIQTPHCCVENDFTLPDAKQHGAMVEKTLKEIKLAAALGAKYVRLFAGFTPSAEMTEVTWQRMLAAFHVSQALCDTLGLTISIETHGKITMKDGAAHHVHTVSTDPVSLKRLLKDLPPKVGFNFDPGNLKAVAPEDRTYGVGLLNPRINYCHLKDWRRKGDGWEAVAIGDDDLDYPSLFAQMEYRGVYLIEYEPTGDIQDGIARSLKYLRDRGVAYRLQ